MADLSGDFIGLLPFSVIYACGSIPTPTSAIWASAVLYLLNWVFDAASYRYGVSLASLARHLPDTGRFEAAGKPRGLTFLCSRVTFCANVTFCAKPAMPSEHKRSGWRTTAGILLVLAVYVAGYLWMVEPVKPPRFR